VLTDIQRLIDQPTPSEMALIGASNQFYTLIPHDFGDKNPPIIRTREALKDKLTVVLFSCRSPFCVANHCLGVCLSCWSWVSEVMMVVVDGDAVGH